MLIDPRYPIGPYVTEGYSDDTKEKWLLDIRFLPELLEQSIENLDSEQLHTPYREGGWTIHQVVHHLADSHMNAYIRFKLAYTEDHPTIKPYYEERWAVLQDIETVPLNVSVTLLHALHQRWFFFMKDFDWDDWSNTFYHPEQQKDMNLWYALGLYSWHGRHHVAHIQTLREKMNWR